MKILLLGSSGFIGKRLLTALQNANYQVIYPSRKTIDFLNPNGDDFKKLLTGVDIVINTVGIMSRDKQLMQAVHCDTPILFAKLAKDYANQFNKNIQWINLSALGADEKSNVAFVKSKGQGDKGILDLADNYFKVNIIRPSLIYGDGGASTKLFLQLAKLPILPLPNGGNFNIQPIHADDVVLGIIKLIEIKKPVRGEPVEPLKGFLSTLRQAQGERKTKSDNIINVAGNQVLTLSYYLKILRKNHYHKDNLIIIPIPFFIAKMGALVLQHFTNLISVDSLILLKNGNVAENGDFNLLLGREPIPCEQFY